MLKRGLLFCVPFLLWGTFLFAQTRVITGKVSESGTKAALSGTTISVKGARGGTSSGADGNFSLTAPAGEVTLQVSSVGFASKAVTVPAGQNAVNIELGADAANLNEVVVTALGISREAKTLVYATQTVKASQLTEVRDANNVLNSLQGKVANVVITQGSGGPGSGARIVLRGNRSIQGTNNALIVVDGVPIVNRTDAVPGSDFGAVQGSDGASSINPDDIESVNILRGASAAALYGSAASNGVVLITTKKGSKDKMSVVVNSGIAFESTFALPKFQDSYGQGNAGALIPNFGDSWGAKMTGQSYTNYLGNAASYSPQPDNVKDYFRTGTSLNNSVGVSGGNEKAQTYLSYTNNLIQGIIPDNDLTRHTVTLRLSNQFSKHFSTDAKITYISQDIKNRPRTGEENSPVSDLYQIPRNVSLSDAKQYQKLDALGIPVPTAWPSTLSSIYQNPYWMTYNTSLNEQRDRLMGFISGKYQITKWLSVTGRANVDKTFDQLEEKYKQGTLLWATQAGGKYIKNKIVTTQKWFDAIFEGNHTITKDLKVNYHVGAIYQDVKYDQNSSTADGLNVINKFSLNFATSPALVSTGTQVTTQSLFGQLNFALKEAVFLEGTLRNDWDSRLPSPYSYKYASVGLSAIISDLLVLPSSISFLKASVNYAEVGNGGQFGLLNTTYAYTQGAGNGFLARSNVLPIPDLKPEISKSFEGGLDARFLDNRLGFTLTYYHSNSINQLLKISLPTASGYATQYINAGKIQNKGLELVLNATPVKSKNVTWDIALNMGLNRNKVVKLSDVVKRIYLTGGGYGRSGTPVVVEGGAYGDILAHQWLKDAKGNHLVTDAGLPLTSYATGADQGYIGNFNPKEVLGLTNSVSYKAFSLRVLIDGRIGGTMISGTEMNLAFSGITEGTEQYREGGLNLGGVSSTGQSNSKTITAQSFWQTASGKRYGVGEFFAYDATSFRVRELSIGYDIPIGSKIFIKSARFSAVARNLFWLYRGKSILDIPGMSKRTMWFDPDMSLGNGNYQGVEYGALPSTRSLGFNLRLNF